MDYAAAIGLIAAAATATLTLRPVRDAASLALVAVAGILVVWSTTLVLHIPQPQHAWVTIFSALALLVSTAFIRTAVRADDGQALAFGILFALVFLVVRWTSVIENMLWSGLMLLVAGATFLLVARLWRNRDRPLATAGRLR